MCVVGMFVNIENIFVILVDIFVVDTKYFFDMVCNMLVSCGVKYKTGVFNYDKKVINLTFGIYICL